MKKLKSILFLILFAFFAIFQYGCKKDNEDDNSNQDNTTHLADFFNQHIVASQFFNATIGDHEDVIGNKGTVIHLNNVGFKDQSGNNVSGDIQIELKEIYSKKDMILSNLTTMATNGNLISGGMIYLNVTQNGNNLKINPNTPLIISYLKPAAAQSYPMSTYYGKYDNDKNAIIWNLPDTIYPSTNPVIDTTSGNYYYNLHTDSLHWINCDYFYNQTPLTNIYVTVPNNYFDTNTNVYIVFNNMNLIAKFCYYSNHIFSLGGGYIVPIGINATIVTFSSIGSNYYSSFTSLTVQDGQQLSVTPVLTTEAEFINELNSLP